MSEFKIEKSVPVPASLAGRRAKYPWRDMDVGDSFFVPLNGEQRLTDLRSQVSRAAYSAFGKGGSATRQEGNGVRVWRIK